MKRMIVSLLILLLAAGCGRKSPDWVQEPMRWAQLNMAETDPPNFDLDWWMDHWRACRVDGITITFGGERAFYPTDVPLHKRARLLGDRDLVGEIVAAAHAEGWRVMGRFDPNTIYEAFYQSHPDWAYLDKNHQPVLRYDDAARGDKLYYTCINGPYFTEFIPQIIKEVMARYHLDGVYANAWYADGTGRLCYSKYCTDKFRRETGLEVPLERDINDPAYRRWFKWHRKCYGDIYKTFVNAAREVNPEAVFIGNIWRSAEMKTLLDAGADVLQMENQVRDDRRNFVRLGLNGRIYRSLSRGRPYWLLFGSWYAPGAEVLVWAADLVSTGARPWSAVTGGIQEDRRTFPAIREFMDFHYRNEEYYRDIESAATVALVFSQSTMDFYAPGFDATQAELNGFYWSLLEARIPFDIIQSEDMTARDLRRYEAVILPNTACLSDRNVRDLNSYVRGGGSLVATFDTGRFDEDRNERPESALLDLFGVRRVATEPYGPLLHSYGRILARGPLTDGFEGTDIIAWGGRMVAVEGTGGTASPLYLLPTYPIYPPETAWSEVDTVNVPLAYLNRRGRSRLVYFPGEVGTIYWNQNLPDIGRLLANAVRWAANGRLPAEVDGPGLIDLGVFRQNKGKRLIVHLVNLTSAATWRPPTTEIIPLRAQTVTIATNGPGRDMKGRLLVSGRELTPTVSGDSIRFDIPGIEHYEVLVVEGS